jgi:hypothetical protein
MKKLVSWLAVYFVAFLFTGVNAQKITVKSGSFDVLKGQETISIEYAYDNMAVGKFDVEQEYIDKKVTEYNEKEPGTGDTWAKAWVNDREARFHPRFEEEFNHTMVGKGVNLRISSASDYTMIVHTTFTEPGFNVGIARKNASIDLEVTLVEAENPENVAAVMIVKGSPGRGVMGYDFDTGFRLQEAYAKAGKEIAYYIWKKYLK